MNDFRVGDRVIVNGSEVHCTEYVINKPGVIVEQEPMHPVYDWRVKVGGDFLFFTEGELTPAPAKDDVPQPGDRVRVTWTREDERFGSVTNTVEATAAQSESLRSAYPAMGKVEAGVATVTILERATPTNSPANDPVGTLRESVDWYEYSAVKVGDDRWLVIEDPGAGVGPYFVDDDRVPEGAVRVGLVTDEGTQGLEAFENGTPAAEKENQR